MLETKVKDSRKLAKSNGEKINELRDKNMELNKLLREGKAELKAELEKENCEKIGLLEVKLNEQKEENCEKIGLLEDKINEHKRELQSVRLLLTDLENDLAPYFAF